MKTARPFLKWAGGKAQLLDELLARAPKTFHCYYEPFVGGGAMYFALADKDLVHPNHGIVLSDANAELITTYTAIRDDVDDVVRLLKHYRGHFARDFSRAYYQLRSTKPNFAAQVAARMIALNKTCFNGLYRVNSKGLFNVPAGKFKSPPMICDEENLRACSAALQGVTLRHYGYHMLLGDGGGPKCDDFVYFDPPYVPVSDTSNFTGYTPGGFGPADQGKLAGVFQRLDTRGVKVMLSNAESPIVRKLYRGFHIERVEARRNINSKASARGPIGELIVRNYR